MTDEQLKRACKTRDERAYLAGLQSVVKRENLEMRRASGLGELTRPAEAIKADRDERIARAREYILPHIPEEGTITTVELTEAIGCHRSKILAPLSMLAAEGYVERHEPPHRKAYVRWSLPQ